MWPITINTLTCQIGSTFLTTLLCCVVIFFFYLTSNRNLSTTYIVQVVSTTLFWGVWNGLKDDCSWCFCTQRYLCPSCVDSAGNYACCLRNVSRSTKNNNSLLIRFPSMTSVNVIKMKKKKCHCGCKCTVKLFKLPTMVLLIEHGAYRIMDVLLASSWNLPLSKKWLDLTRTYDRSMH